MWELWDWCFMFSGQKWMGWQNPRRERKDNHKGQEMMTTFLWWSWCLNGCNVIFHSIVTNITQNTIQWWCFNVCFIFCDCHVVVYVIMKKITDDVQAAVPFLKSVSSFLLFSNPTHIHRSDESFHPFTVDSLWCVMCVHRVIIIQLCITVSQMQLFSLSSTAVWSSTSSWFIVFQSVMDR